MRQLHQWLLFELHRRFPSFQWQVCRKRVLLRPQQQRHHPLSPELCLMHQHFFLFLRYLPTLPRRQVGTGHLGVLRVPLRKHRHGQRCLRLRQVRRDAQAHSDISVLLIFGLLPGDADEHRVDELRGPAGHARVHAVLLQLLLPQRQLRHERRLRAQGVPQDQCQLLLPLVSRAGSAPRPRRTAERQVPLPQGPALHVPH